MPGYEELEIFPEKPDVPVRVRFLDGKLLEDPAEGGEFIEIFPDRPDVPVRVRLPDERTP